MATVRQVIFMNTMSGEKLHDCLTQENLYTEAIRTAMHDFGGKREDILEIHEVIQPVFFPEVQFWRHGYLCVVNVDGEEKEMYAITYSPYQAEHEEKKDDPGGSAKRGDG